MEIITSPSLGYLESVFLKLDATNSPITGDLTFNDDIAIKFGHNATTQRALYFNTNSDTLFLTSKQGEVWTDLASEGGLYIYTNVQADGAGNYEPVLQLANSGAVNLSNSTQGTVANRIFTVGMNKFLLKPDTNRTDAFQIQASDSSAVLNVDTVNGRVGIGTDSPVAPLEIKSASTSSLPFQITRSANSNPMFSFGEGGGGAGLFNLYNTSGVIKTVLSGGNTKNYMVLDEGSNATLTMGGTGNTTGFLNVFNNKNIIALQIRANAIQAAGIWQIQNSSSAALSGADKRGILFSHGGTNVTNVFMGDNAGNVNTVGGGNFALGSNSLALNTNGISNIAIGSQALGSFNNGDENVAIGRQAGFIRSGGSWNVFIGSSAGRSGSSNSNVGIGTSSLYTANSGTNVAIGTNSGKAVTGGGNVLIGNGIGKTLLTAIDNQLHIHNADTTTPLIYGEFDTPLLKIHGRFQTNEDRVKSTETSTTTATMSDDVEIHICNGTTDYTLTLPTAVTGKVITITNKNTATITLSGTISSISATSILYEGESIELVYDGTEWV